MPADLSVVIVSYNTRDLLAACLTSVLQPGSGRFPDGHNWPHPLPPAPPAAYEVIVVDNASADESVALVREHFPAVQVIALDQNVGFAAANNIGLARASGRHLMLLNPDTIVLDHALDHMVHFLDTHPRVGAVGGRLLNPDGTPQHSAFRFPNLWMSLFDFFPINHRVINSRLNGRYPLRDYEHPFPIDHPLGADLAVRRSVIEQVGLLDEGYFMYCEELDWCMRIKRAGWEIWYVPAPIIHFGAQSTRQFREAMFIELYRARYRFFRKYYSRPWQWAVRQVVRLGLRREMWRTKRAHAHGLLSDADYAARMQAYRTVFAL